MKRLIFAFLVLAACWTGAAPAHAAEVILNFDSTVSVARDGELTVTERIRVRAEGREIRRGIYRDFPLTFADAGGRVREVGFHLIGVTRDGRPEPHFTERRSGGIMRIYAGDKNVMITAGEHTYEFRYRTSRQIRWFDGKAELNWNVTGNFWNFPILSARYRLQLAEHGQPTRWTAYSGPRGARGTDWRGGISGDGVLTVTTTRQLAPGDGLTVVAALPDGAVTPPTESDEFWYTVFDNRGWIIGGLGFLLVLIYYLYAWNAVGRDPPKGTVIPLFYAPKGVSPALANYIDNWGFGRDKWRAFTAAALSLAVRGLIRFEQDGSTLTFKRTGREPEGGLAILPAGERAIATWLDGQGGTGKIDRTNGTAVASGVKKFTDSIENENKQRFFRRNLGYVAAGIAMTIAVVIGVIAFGGLSEDDILVIVVTLFASFWLGMFLVPVAVALFGAARFPSLVRTIMTLIVLGIFLSIVGTVLQSLFPNGLGDIGIALWSLVNHNTLAIAILAGFTALNGLFVYLMRAPTSLGRPIMDQLAGFKLYLETAESARLNLGAPEITAERFEALLPYAVALKVEKPFAEAFEAALRRAYPDDPDPMRKYQPTWQSGAWSSTNLSNAVAATVASTSSALASAMPVSSSSSGFSSSGGGSGGGGGGGGGGGW